MFGTCLRKSVGMKKQPCLSKGKHAGRKRNKSLVGGRYYTEGIDKIIEENKLTLEASFSDGTSEHVQIEIKDEDPAAREQRLINKHQRITEINQRMMLIIQGQEANKRKQ